MDKPKLIIGGITMQKIRELYNLGKNHHEIALEIMKDKKNKGINTSENECLREVEMALLEMHRRKN